MSLILRILRIISANSRRRRLAALLLALAALLAACASRNVTPTPGSLALTLMVTNDTWGQLEACG